MAILVGLPRLLQAAAFWGFDDARREHLGKVWETGLDDFSNAAYARAVARVLAAFEAETGKRLAPGARGRAALKVYTHSGPGLCTPPALTLALLRALEERGFSRDRLIIFDLREASLRAAGYLPPLSRRAEGNFFAGVPVLSLDEENRTSPGWFYDSPLPEEFTSPLGRELLRREEAVDRELARKSFLPVTLLQDVDFWINLPMVTDQYALGLNGVMVNATLWNITNQTRFFGSPVNAPVAVAEIAAVPELQDTWALSIVTLEQYQYIGGPAYNAYYTVSEPLLWASADPVLLDTLLVERLNVARTRAGFRRLPTLLPYVDYAVGLRLGFGLSSQVRWIRVP
jgi:hypothetical protein